MSINKLNWRTFLFVSILSALACGGMGCGQLFGQSHGPSGVLELKPNYESPVSYSYRVHKSFPHDCTAFTQGLVFDDGELFESTGLRGASTLRRVRLENGEVLQSVSLEQSLFGEGITIWQDQIFLLTWQSQRGFIYERESFNIIREFTYSNVQNEGWGITDDNERLIMSDGSSYLYFLDPQSLEEIGRIEVIDQTSNTDVTLLNELEYINGLVFANVWQSNRIAVIDPETGLVGAWIDMSGLGPASNPAGCPRPDVLNGIAYDIEGDRLFVTGKRWDELHQIEILVDE